MSGASLWSDPPMAAGTGFVLRTLEVYNWGPFGGLHRAEMDARGTAIIGATGSGKTTLVDAFMTLLVAQPRYNLASTGGHESDRDLMSYLRGVSGPGAGADSGDDSHVARPDKTTCGIAATLVRDAESVQLIGLFWTDGPGFAAPDRSDLWLFVRQAQPLDLAHWLAALHDGGARVVKQQARGTDGVQPFETKKAYLAQLRRFFGVGDNAFHLLNRAAGLKQLNSIDEIFRELVLDDRAAYTRAAEVVSEFDTLVGIHEELRRAMEQRHSLLPVARGDEQHRVKSAQQAFERSLQGALADWFALAGVRLWQRELESLGDTCVNLERRRSAAGQRIHDQEAGLTALRQRHADAGGANLKTLQQWMADKDATLQKARRMAGDYAKLAATLALDASGTLTAFDLNRSSIEAARPAFVQRAQELQDAAFAAGVEHSANAAALRVLQDDLAKIRNRPGSNLPSDYQDFRADLAAALGLADDDIPFVAELVEVHPDEKPWRGAIERALGGERLRLLVPPGQMPLALRWVNTRHNRLHVRLLDPAEVLRQRHGQAAQPFTDGFVRKLTLKQHKLQPALQALLALHDRHCVASTEALRSTEHAMTAEGLLSGPKGRFDKQDQRALDQGWLTGFDNRDRLRALAQEIEAAQVASTASEQAVSQAQRAHEAHRQMVQLREQLMQVEFGDIDTAGIQSEIDKLRQQIDALRQPGSELAELERGIDALVQDLAALRDQVSDIDREIGGSKTLHQSAQRQLEAASQAASTAAPEGFSPALSAELPDLGAARAHDLVNLQNAEQGRLRARLEATASELAQIAQGLVRAMGLAKKVDTGDLSEAGTELADVPAYLERLCVLEQEALPEKRERFQRYLNLSSDQGVTQLLNDIESEVGAVEDRIDELNETLARVEFQPGRHLQLVTRRIVHQSLKDLQAAQRQLRTAVLRDDGGEAHFLALQEVVRQLRQAADNRRTQAARALLDPRWRLQFAVALLETASGKIIEMRSGSQGGSGGEKEIIASYILTASLSYALAPESMGQPRFATIVLDEAFSRTSQAVAARIVAALRAFGLNPLFVTPNKEMRLLREHTRAAILVIRKGQQARLASLRWEELDAHALAQTRAARTDPETRAA